MFVLEGREGQLSGSININNLHTLLHWLAVEDQVFLITSGCGGSLIPSHVQERVQQVV